MLLPMGDKSYVDFLPKLDKNHKNFVSFISETHIMAHFSGRYLIFDDRGRFCQKVVFRDTDYKSMPKKETD